MIAITAYTQPFSADEPPHVFQPEESEEHSGFAQLLAGLLQNVSGTKDALDELAAEKTEDTSRLNIFSNENTPVVKHMFDPVSYADIDLSDTAIEKEYRNIINIDNLFNRSFEPENIDNFDAETLEQIALLISELNPSSKENNAKDTSLIAEKIAANPSSQQLTEFAAALNSGTKFNTGEINPAVMEKIKKLAGENKSSFTETLPNNEKIEIHAAQSDLKNENSILDDFRRSRKDRIAFEVRDMRTGMPNNIESSHSLVETRMQGAAEINLDLRLPDYGLSADKSISHAQTSWEVKAGTALENMLARELHQNFNGDIVRHASMALRDGGSGTIKITLHPETLGNVKIHLEMTENKITGLIVVESQEALNAFRREIAALEQAFKDSGFADASLDLSFSADGSGSHKQEFKENSFMQKTASANYEDSYELELMPDYFGHANGAKPGLVNMLA